LFIFFYYRLKISHVPVFSCPLKISHVQVQEVERASRSSEGPLSAALSANCGGKRLI